MLTEISKANSISLLPTAASAFTERLLKSYWNKGHQTSFSMLFFLIVRFHPIYQRLLHSFARTNRAAIIINKEKDKIYIPDHFQLPNYQW